LSFDLSLKHQFIFQEDNFSYHRYPTEQALHIWKK